MSRFTALHTITDDSALGGSTIVRSLRFNSSDSHKLTRTFGTNSSDTTKTFSWTSTLFELLFELLLNSSK